MFIFVPQHERAVHGQGIRQLSGQEDVCSIGGKRDVQEG